MPKSKSKIIGNFFSLAKMEQHMWFVHSEGAHGLINLIGKCMTKCDDSDENGNSCDYH